MTIRVGIVGSPHGWNHVLAQEGVPFGRVTDEQSLEAFSVLVAGEDCDDQMLDRLRGYVPEGGALLCPATTYARLRNVSTGSEFVHYVLPHSDSLFAGVDIVDVNARCVLAWQANELEADHGIRTAFAGPWERGSVIALPFDPARLVLDSTFTSKSFYSAERRLPFERVSRFAKAAVHHLVSRSLQWLHHRRGMMYAHTWYFPAGLPDLFSLRIDCDHGSKHSIERLQDLLDRLSVPATWFVDMKNQEPHAGIFLRRPGDEVGVHCYEHREHRTYDDTRESIRVARIRLEAHGISTRGYAAPYGFWTPDVGRAIRDSGVEYSSEFAYDYDGFPSFPLLGGEQPSALQIPIHPISIGSLKRQGYRPEQMKRYFERVFRDKLSIRHPLFFYHHPNDGYQEVLESLVRLAQQNGVRAVTMGEYGGWWKRRQNLNLRIDVDGKLLRTASSERSEDMWLRLTRPGGEEAIVPLRSEIALTSLHWQSKPEREPIPSDYRRVRNFNYRIPLTRTVDFVASLLDSAKH